MRSNWRLRDKFYRERKSWECMKQRCENPKSPAFKNYGARGIKVCDRWRSSFKDFLADMGPRPKGTSLDRIDGQGNYEPGNCRWATRKVQNTNRRTVRMVTIGDRTQCMADWARTLGMQLAGFEGRIARGWSAEELLLPPNRLRRVKARGRALASTPTTRKDDGR